MEVDELIRRTDGFSGAEVTKLSSTDSKISGIAF